MPYRAIAIAITSRARPAPTPAAVSSLSRRNLSGTGRGQLDCSGPLGCRDRRRGGAACPARLRRGLAGHRHLDRRRGEARRAALGAHSLCPCSEARRAVAADYRGQVVVLNFWASWCPPCVDELPLLERTQRRIESRGATVWASTTRTCPRTRPGSWTGSTSVSRPPRPRRRIRRGVRHPRLPGDVRDRPRGRIAAARRGPVTSGWLEAALSPLLGENA